MLKFAYTLFTLTILLQACTKQEIITGKIIGRISVFNQSCVSVQDRSGVLVNLLQEGSIVKSDTTDPAGKYLFENISYGKYKIYLKKDNYIQGWAPPFIYHVGGYSPTYTSSGIYEIPTYDLTLDSMGYDPVERDLLIYLKFNGDTAITYNLYGYPFVAYAGNSPDVSKDNYITKGNGILRDYLYVNSSDIAVPVYGKANIYSFNPPVKNVITGTVYLRIYPLANGQGYSTSTLFYPEALGKPSNVISFIWNDLVGK